MKDYETRLAEASAYHDAALLRIETTPAPEGQKYPIGSFVRIAKELGSPMRHFESDTVARVEHTYAHAYYGNDVKSYSLTVRRSDGKWSSIAWYDEGQLTAITDAEEVAQLRDDYKNNLL